MKRELNIIMCCRVVYPLKMYDEYLYSQRDYNKRKKKIADILYVYVSEMSFNPLFITK